MLSHSQLSSAMLRAIMLAHRGPTNDDNPQVGCVILDAQANIVAEGFHEGAGTDHAEVMALNALDPAHPVDRLTAVVTLEPCHHTGTTPPCSQALLNSGITNIVYGQPDEGAASGGGASALLAAGKHVVGGIESEATRALLEPWRQRTGTTTRGIIAKWAQSVDGRLAAADNTSQWITSQQARDHVHVQRALADIIVTTTASVRWDNPSLTARNAEGELLVSAADQPLPVVFGQSTLPDDAKIHQHPALSHHKLSAVPRFTGENLVTDFEACAQLIGRKPRVFIEAGPTFLNALLTHDLADQLLIYTAPILLGGPNTAISDIQISTLQHAQHYVYAHVLQLGPDIVTTLRKAQ